MSYHIDLIGNEPCPTCGCYFNPPGHTHRPPYNLWRLFDFAITGEVRNGSALTSGEFDIRRLHSKVAGDSIVLLETALARLRDANNIATVAALAPKNPADAHIHAITVLVWMRDRAKAMPLHVWCIT